MSRICYCCWLFTIGLSSVCCKLQTSMLASKSNNKVWYRTDYTQGLLGDESKLKISQKKALPQFTLKFSIGLRRLSRPRKPDTRKKKKKKWPWLTSSISTEAFHGPFFFFLRLTHQRKKISILNHHGENRCCEWRFQKLKHTGTLAVDASFFINLKF